MPRDDVGIPLVMLSAALLTLFILMIGWVFGESVNWDVAQFLSDLRGAGV